MRHWSVCAAISLLFLSAYIKFSFAAAPPGINPFFPAAAAAAANENNGAAHHQAAAAPEGQNVQDELRRDAADVEDAAD